MIIWVWRNFVQLEMLGCWKFRLIDEVVGTGLFRFVLSVPIVPWFTVSCLLQYRNIYSVVVNIRQCIDCILTYQLMFFISIVSWWIVVITWISLDDFLVIFHLSWSVPTRYWKKGKREWGLTFLETLSSWVCYILLFISYHSSFLVGH